LMMTLLFSMKCLRKFCADYGVIFGVYKNYHFMRLLVNIYFYLNVYVNRSHNGFLNFKFRNGLLTFKNDASLTLDYFEAIKKEN